MENFKQQCPQGRVRWYPVPQPGRRTLHTLECLQSREMDSDSECRREVTGGKH